MEDGYCTCFIPKEKLKEMKKKKTDKYMVPFDDPEDPTDGSARRRGTGSASTADEVIRRLQEHKDFLLKDHENLARKYQDDMDRMAKLVDKQNGELQCHKKI